jgi:hypothetical protein
VGCHLNSGFICRDMKSRDSFDCDKALQHLVRSLIDGANLSLLYQALQQITPIYDPACFHNSPRVAAPCCGYPSKIERVPIRRTRPPFTLCLAGPVLPPPQCLPLFRARLARYATMISLLASTDHLSEPAMVLSINLPPVLLARPE